MPDLGTVYLLHLSRPLAGRRGARHYLGFAVELADRIARHLRGDGAAVLAEAVRQGIPWRLVRTWEGVSRHFERRLKRRHQEARLCPLCRGRALAAHARRERRRRAASKRRVEV